MESIFEEERLEVQLKEIVVGLRDPDDLPTLGLTVEGCVCVFCVYSYMYVFGGQRHVQVTRMDLDITEVVHIQGHWISIPVRRQRLPSIYQARQLFNMESNKRGRGDDLTRSLVLMIVPCLRPKHLYTMHNAMLYII